LGALHLRRVALEPHGTQDIYRTARFARIVATTCAASLAGGRTLSLTRIDMETPAGFADLFLQKAAAQASRPFATFNGATVRFAELERQSRSFAAALRARGVIRGARVAIMMSNQPAVLACLFGIARSGNLWVPINPVQRGAGLRYIIEHAEPAVVIVDEPQLAALLACGADLAGISVVVQGAGEAREGGAHAATSDLAAMLSGTGTFDESLPGPDDTFAIMYTSGTTGRPKGVIVTHAMMRFAGEAALLLSDVADGDVLFMWEPLYHIGGAQVLLMPVLRDLTLAMVEQFSASRFWDQVRAADATHIHYLGGILQMLLKQPPTPLDRQHRVRIGWGAGCAKESWLPFQQRFGVQLREAYGMTETSSIASVNGTGTAGSVGHSVPWFEIGIIDQTGNDVPRGIRGEIVVAARRHGSLFPSYFRDPEATARALLGGRLHTQDLGSFNEAGELFFHGRMTDSMRCRGENVSAWEVEHIALNHPAVDDCAVTGVAAEVGEQDIKLFIKLKAGRTVEPGELSDWLAGQLTPYQNPRYIAFVEDFERTPSQRIMKHLLSAATDDCWDRLASAARGVSAVASRAAKAS
jgi:crotonobetaine/carnitine-CoA ligase